MSTFQTGSVIADRYRVVKRLGKGGFAEVYLVEHLHLDGEQYALKVLRSDFEGTEQKARFAREMKTARKLVHPSIVVVREFSQVGDLLCYAMDYVEGPTLIEVLRREQAAGRPALSVERAVARIREVLEALAFAHEQGVVHRDIKPENVLVEAEGTPKERAKVLDFGIAKILSDGTKTLSQGGIGTPAYMPAEQAEGKKGAIGPWSDIYATGCTLFELLTGRTPFVSESSLGYVVQHMHEPVPPFADVAPALEFPAGLEDIVRRALAKDPKARYGSAEDMLEAIEALGIASGRRPQRSRVEVQVPVAPLPPRPPLPAPSPPPGLDWSAPFEGQVVDRYEIVRLVGEGGFGIVCEAVDRTLGRRVALKALRPELTNTAAFRERFQQEGRLLARLEHPAIVTVYAAGVVGATCYLAMEFCEGETLDARIVREGALAPSVLADLLRPICGALRQAHAQGIVHRDLKPENIFLLRDGRAKILDFGIAKVARGDSDLRITAGQQLVGSLAYVSPEQARGEPLDGRSDLYSLGALLFEALTGRLPFEHDDARELVRAHLNEPPPRLRDARPDLAASFPDALEDVIVRALAKDRQARFPDALSVAAALEAAVRPVPPPFLPPPTATSTPAPARPSGYRSVPVVPAPALASAPSIRVPAPTSGRLATAASLASVGAPSSPAQTPAHVFKGRARLDLPAEASPDGLRTLFVIAAPRLRFGRSRPDQDPAAAGNTLVLRVLPCRNAVVDHANFVATKEISGGHATIEERDGAAFLTDHSARGTTIDDVRVPKGTPARLPSRFRLGVAGVLTFEGRVLPEHPGPDRPLEAVYLRRADNHSHHGYLWVVRRAALGPAEDAAVHVAAPLAGQVVVDGQDIRLEIPPGLDVRPAEVGDEAREG